MRTRLGVTTLAVMAFSAAPAFAEPAHTGTLSSTAEEFAWDGGPGSGLSLYVPGVVSTALGCGAPAGYDCEDTLLEVKDAGELTVAIDSATDQQGDPAGLIASPDLDLYIYEANSEGEIDEDADPVAQQADFETDETATLKKAKPGFYVARVEFFMAQDETYKGLATLVTPQPVVTQTVAETVTVPPVVEAPPVPAAPAAPAPVAPKTSAAARKKALAKCRAKAKKIKSAKKRKTALKRCAAKARRS